MNGEEFKENAGAQAVMACMPQEADESVQALYTALAPALAEGLERWQLPAALLRVRVAKNYTSLLMGSLLLCRLYGGKRPGLEIPCAEPVLLPEGYPQACVHPGRDKTRLDIPEQADAAALLGPVLTALAGRVAAQIPKSFDCCHRYAQCSDEGRCVNPDPAQAVGCGYRRVLAEGKRYYGKNRNV